jgi:hypothetical protein
MMISTELQNRLHGWHCKKTIDAQVYQERNETVFSRGNVDQIAEELQHHCFKIRPGQQILQSCMAVRNYKNSLADCVCVHSVLR